MNQLICCAKQASAENNFNHIRNHIEFLKVNSTFKKYAGSLKKGSSAYIVSFVVCLEGCCNTRQLIRLGRSLSPRLK